MNVKEVFFSSESEESGWLPERAIDVLDYLARLIGAIPEQYRGMAKVIFIGHETWGDPVTRVEIFYERPETEAEIVKRLDSELRRKECEKADELKLLKRLLEKHPVAI